METIEFDDEILIHHLETDQDADRFERGFIAAYQIVFRGEPYFEDVSPDHARFVYREITRSADAICLICEDMEGKVAGFAMALPLVVFRSVASILAGLVPAKHTYYLAELGVVPEYRGRGLGRVLIMERIKRMDPNLYSHVVLRMTERRGDSWALYSDMGFENMGVSMGVSAKRVDGQVRSDRRVFLARVLSQVDVE